MVSRSQAGFVTPAFVAAIGLTLVLLVMVANLLVVHYARGVMQTAVEEAARQGVAAGVAACEVRATSVVQGGLGAMAADVDAVACSVGADGAVVTLSATFAAWLPALPAQTVDVRAQAMTRPAVP